MTTRIRRRLAVLAAAVLSTAASLHAEQYVRYEHDGAVSWGRLDGSTIHQLDGAPYAGGSATGKWWSRRTSSTGWKTRRKA